MQESQGQPRVMTAELCDDVRQKLPLDSPTRSQRNGCTGAGVQSDPVGCGEQGPASSAQLRAGPGAFSDLGHLGLGSECFLKE